MDPGFPFRFTCQRSGNCCSIPGGFVRISADEAAALARHLGLPLDAFRSRYLDAGGERLKAGLDHRCVFLTDGKPTSCSVYPVRPHKCRTWPYWDELRNNPTAVQRAMRTCPGISLPGGGQD